MEWFALKSSEAKFAQENIFNYLMDIIRKKMNKLSGTQVLLNSKEKQQNSS